MIELTKEQKESIDLQCTSKGIYSWSIKVLDKEINESTLRRLEIIDHKLKEVYRKNEYQEIDNLDKEKEK